MRAANRPKLEPRILLCDPEKSYHAPHRITDRDIFDNLLIHGDNLLALKSLEQEFTGSVKCIFIDPPYNTGAAFEHYDDGIEHSLWLTLIRERLELLWRLLSAEGSIWITIDDREAHYLKVLCDEVFGRSAFVANLVWQKRTSRENRAAIGSAHDHILLYAKAGPVRWKDIRNPLPANEAGYGNPDAYTAEGDVKAFRLPVDDLANIRRYVFGGFRKCLYPVQKFGSDSERRFSVILEDDSKVLKWVKPVPGQFQIYYSKENAYEPDFVVETDTEHYLCEPKRADQIETEEVQAKKRAALEWCQQATEHAVQHGSKPWSYILIPHEAITDNMTLAGLAMKYLCHPVS